MQLAIRPIVDCGVHYVDVMCQMTGAKPVTRARGGRAADRRDAQGMYNYGHLQVTFDDGSVGWYEAGWGPMMSETAFFVKDVIGPKGSVSIVMARRRRGSHRRHERPTPRPTRSSVTTPTLAADGMLAQADRRITTADEPSHDDLCEREQRYLLKAIDEDIDLGDHMDDAVKSLRIVLAADQSVRTGEVVRI